MAVSSHGSTACARAANPGAPLDVMSADEVGPTVEPSYGRRVIVVFDELSCSAVACWTVPEHLSPPALAAKLDQIEEGFA